MKRTTIAIIAGVCLLGMLLAGIAGAAEDSKAAQPSPAPAPAPKPQTVCPVMGGKINKSLFVEADGKRIYVCCPGCIDAVKKEPQKYIKELEAKGITLEKAKQPL